MRLKLSLRYGADLGRSRFVMILQSKKKFSNLGLLLSETQFTLGITTQFGYSVLEQRRVFLNSASSSVKYAPAGTVLCLLLSFYVQY